MDPERLEAIADRLSWLGGDETSQPSYDLVPGFERLAAYSPDEDALVLGSDPRPTRSDLDAILEETGFSKTPSPRTAADRKAQGLRTAYLLTQADRSVQEVIAERAEERGIAGLEPEHVIAGHPTSYFVPERMASDPGGSKERISDYRVHTIDRKGREPLRIAIPLFIRLRDAESRLEGPREAILQTADEQLRNTDSEQGSRTLNWYLDAQAGFGVSGILSAYLSDSMRIGKTRSYARYGEKSRYLPKSIRKVLRPSFTPLSGGRYGLGRPTFLGQTERSKTS